MAAIWVDSIGRSLDGALDRLAAALQDCPDELWETSMWGVSVPGPDHKMPGPEGTLVTDPARRHALAQRWSTPWSVAWHALECLDYDFNGEFGPWTPPPPFTVHWQLTSLPGAWSRSELLGYVDACRQRARATLAGMTDEKAATPMPQAHRYRGQPYARVITNLVGHTTEHAAQIRQFITAR